jgi:hypothetical protein
VKINVFSFTHVTLTDKHVFFSEREIHVILFVGLTNVNIFLSTREAVYGGERRVG